MARRYHINPETKEVGVCNAEIRCKFAENGEEPKHYTDPIEAHFDAEKMLENEYGAFNSLSRNENNPPESFQRDFPAGERLSEYVESGDEILYNGDVIGVDTFSYNGALLAYEIDTTDGETVYIPDSDWYEKSKIKLLGKNEVMKDPEEFKEDFVAGETFGNQVSVGDQFLYNGVVYKVKDFNYNRALLQYEIQTNKGEVSIPDYNWYENPDKIKLLSENIKLKNVDDFTKSTTPGSDGGNFEEELRNSGQFYYEGKIYRNIRHIEYNSRLSEYNIRTDQGPVNIPDRDWYDDSNVRILPNNF